MDIISRLLGCAGQAADAVSAYTQVKMEDAPKLLKIPKAEYPDIGIRLPRLKWPKSWSSMEDPVVPLERKLYIEEPVVPLERNLSGHPLAGLLWVRPFEKVLLEKVPNWERYVDDIKLAREKHNLDLHVEEMDEHVDLGEPTSFL